MKGILADNDCVGQVRRLVTLLEGGDRELELDRVRAAQEAHDLGELRVGQGWANASLGSRLGSHRRSLSAQ